MAGIKLSLGSVASKKPTKKVEFRHTDEFDPSEGSISHNGRGDLVFEVEVEYLDAQQIAEITEAAAKRKMLSVKKKDRGMVTDWRATLEAICRRCVKGWTLNVAACHKLELVGLDYSKFKPTDPVEFSPENLTDVVRASTFGALMYGCLNDFAFWFPADKEQVGNSESGLPGSTGGSPATTASTPT